VGGGGTPTAWAEEAHDVAAKTAYAIPIDRALGSVYFDAAMPAVRLQLLRGGVRLAALLNEIFGGTSTSSSRSTVATSAEPSTSASTSKASPYRGNVRSRDYHAPGCRAYDCPDCTAVFKARRKAEEAGYRPHQACVR
jgi:hypothetical protein